MEILIFSVESENWKGVGWICVGKFKWRLWYTAWESVFWNGLPGINVCEEIRVETVYWKVNVVWDKGYKEAADEYKKCSYKNGVKLTEDFVVVV